MGIPRKLNELDYASGEFIRCFDSLSQAADFHNISTMNIWTSITKNNGRMNNLKLRFQYAEDYIQRTQCKVKQLDYYTGEEIEIYNNLEEAALDNFVSVRYLRDAMDKRNGYMRVKKLRFEYIEVRYGK